MKVIEVGRETNQAREEFFRAIFGENEGYVCVATIRKNRKGFHEEFFRYPDNLDALLEWINRNYHGRNVYFCPQLLSEKKRAKETVDACTCVWADVDEADPGLLEPEPTIVLETSPGRHAAFWLLSEAADPPDAEDASHRMAYKYEALGVDKSGWDLSQLLRVPLTYNVKYDRSGDNFPVVEIVKDNGKHYKLEDFQHLPPVPGYEFYEEPFPEHLMDVDPDDIIDKYKHKLDPDVIDLYMTQPAEDWSASLWKLEMLLLEHGVEREDVFVLCWHSACNKYRRDKRHPSALWKDVCKADTRMLAHYEELNPALPPLLTDKERTICERYNSFVERYVQWAKTRSDAAPQYHEASAFMVLSALVAGTLKLHTSFGAIVPNLWVMILADTTLTRKSTAMDMAMDLLVEIEPEAVLATDGSIEGLLTAIAARPGRPGIFWRDEFSGLLEGMKKKDYMAGMMEAFTKLYDGKYQKRMLRRETIELRDPILNVFCGGIRSRIFELMDHDTIGSGFAPRFIYIEAESDMENFRPLGPAKEEITKGHEDLLKELGKIKDLYQTEMSIRIGEQKITNPRIWDVQLTDEAWERYNELLKTMVTFGIESKHPEVFTPTMDRLSTSGLKCAVLLAASRQDPSKKGHVVVELKDILKAIEYVEKWRVYSIDVVENAGKTVTEKKVEMIYKAIKRGGGVSRSRIMQNYHLTSRDTDWILETLEQRGLIKRTKNGKKGETLTPLVDPRTGDKPSKKTKIRIME